MSDLTGKSFGAYEIVRQIGKGGMAVVYLARQKTVDRLVAVKVISAVYSQEPDFRARFDQEARTIAHLEHPHILPVIDYGEEAFGAYLVMRYVDGGTLEQRLTDGPLALSAARDMLARVAAALEYAHNKGVVHRDLKPANILLDETDNPYLTDFGIAKILQSTQRLTKTGAAVGTPAYMAPEQWKAEQIGSYTDQYALGVVLYEMVTGALPFDADTTFGFMHKHVYEQPEPPTLVMHDLPPSAEAVILRALAKLPSSRFPSLTAMSEAFDAALRGEYDGPPPEALYDDATVSVDLGTPPPSGLMTDPSPVGTPAPSTQLAPEAPPTKQAAPPPASAQRGKSRRGIVVIGVVALLTLLVLSVVVVGGLGLLNGEPTETATSRVVVAEATGTESGVAIAAAPSRSPADTATVEEEPAEDGIGEAFTAEGDVASPFAATAAPSNTPTDRPTMPPTHTSEPTATRTPNLTRTADAADVATAQQVVRELTGTSNAAILGQATRQAARTATAVAIASFTDTPTATNTPTRTPTSTPSAPPTRTPLPTSTPAPTLTPTYTPIRALTALSTLRSTATATPRQVVTIVRATVTASIATVAPTPVSCPGLLPSRLLAGDIGLVSDDDPRPVNVRSSPGLSGVRVGQFEVNTQFRVVEGPTCADGYAWYRTQEVGSTLSGWIAESGQGVYYIEPVNITSITASCPGVLASRLVVGDSAVIDTPTGLPLRLHQEAGSSSPIAAIVANGSALTVQDGPICMDGYSWWEIRTGDNRQGWASEADNDSYFIAPVK